MVNSSWYDTPIDIIDGLPSYVGEGDDLCEIALTSNVLFNAIYRRAKKQNANIILQCDTETVGGGEKASFFKQMLGRNFTSEQIDQAKVGVRVKDVNNKGKGMTWFIFPLPPVLKGFFNQSLTTSEAIRNEGKVDLRTIKELYLDYVEHSWESWCTAVGNKCPDLTHLYVGQSEKGRYPGHAQLEKGIEDVWKGCKRLQWIVLEMWGIQNLTDEDKKMMEGAFHQFDMRGLKITQFVFTADERVLIQWKKPDMLL